VFESEDIAINQGKEEEWIATSRVSQQDREYRAWSVKQSRTSANASEQQERKPSCNIQQKKFK
jgi:hypothetical protein